MRGKKIFVSSENRVGKIMFLKMINPELNMEDEGIGQVLLCSKVIVV